MLPWKSLIQLNASSDLAVYLQIANAIISEIKQGIIKPGERIPGTRDLSILLNVHRQTVVSAYDELDAQGWIYSLPSKGTFISERLPEITPRKLSAPDRKKLNAEKTGYDFTIRTWLRTPSPPLRNILGFHDGPDPRIAPIKQLTSAYRRVLSRKSGLHYFSYVDERGKEELRKVLSEHLNSSRGMQTTPDTIFISRGSQMGLYLVSQVIISKGDHVVVGETNYYYTDRAFMNAGANLIRVPVDNDGIDVEAIEKLCRKKKIRAVNVTSHHHYPTTVTLSAARRMKLLSLAERYGFVIVEDDYDYDLHYNSSPILPLASADQNGMVIYVGTLSKTIAPALRIGYVAAPKNLISEISKLRQIVDIQGDPILEQAVAELFTLGEIRRHMKKALKEYHVRRDHLCSLLRENLSHVIDFKTPEGGLAIWARFDKKISLPDLNIELRKKELVLSNGLIHNTNEKMKLNATRMGFGWMNVRESERAFNILYETIRK